VGGVARRYVDHSASLLDPAIMQNGLARVGRQEHGLTEVRFG
jgi:hypothetical protein